MSRASNGGCAGSARDVAGAVPVLALEGVPSEVHAAPGPVAGGRDVDLFVVVLTDVGDPEIAGRAVEREAPRVAQAVGPDLRASATACERVVGRDPVGGVLSSAGIDAQDLAEQRVQRLPVAALRVTGACVTLAATIAEPDVEHAVGTERELSAVVIRLRLVHSEHGAARAHVGAPVSRTRTPRSECCRRGW